MNTSEAARLDSLNLYRILDTATESVFDDLTRLASTICETPISLISLVDESRQWFKSHHGLAARETPRSQAFCAHALDVDRLLIVEDALQDGRFASNPLVIGDPEIRFYAGAPLVMADGAALGTLCVIDREPRKLSETQLSALAVLRDAVVAQIELRRAVSDMQAVQQMLPMCAWCRSIKSGQETDQAWTPLHEFVAERNPVTHGMCPNCVEKVGAELRS